MRTIVGIGLALSLALCAVACSSTAGGAIGDACKGNSDCESNFCELGDPGGNCQQKCKVQSDCPSGSTCTDESKCYPSCTSSSECRTPTYQCVDAKTVDGKATKTCDTP